MLRLSLMLTLATSTLCANEITLSSNTALSSEGYFVLSWQSNITGKNNSSSALEDFTLLQSNNKKMTGGVARQKIPAQGSSTLSGFENGNYFFRVDSQGRSSNVIHVQVKHHSLNNALLFFLCGLLLFCILCFCIYHGHKTNKGNSL